VERESAVREENDPSKKPKEIIFNGDKKKLAI
jgi:hypothetical protein